MTARSWWLDYEAPEPREHNLPKWAQQRLNHLRRQCKRLLAGVIEGRERKSSERVTLSLGSNGYGDTLMRVLPNTARVTFNVTGGELNVELTEFGGRYRIRITGHGTYDRLSDERHDIAVLPALGNVVEVGFVMPAVDIYEPALALEAERKELNP